MSSCSGPGGGIGRGSNPRSFQRVTAAVMPAASSGPSVSTTVHSAITAGFTLNVPLFAGGGDAIYRAAFDRIVSPVLESYAPELVLVSAGFDAAARDPLAEMSVSARGYGYMTQKLVEQEGVFAIFNSIGTEHALAVRDYLNSRKVPQLFVGSGAGRSPRIVSRRRHGSRSRSSRCSGM